MDWSRCTWPLRVPERGREEGEGKGGRGVVIVLKNLQKIEYKNALRNTVDEGMWNRRKKSYKKKEAYRQQGLASHLQ